MIHNSIIRFDLGLFGPFIQIFELPDIPPDLIQMASTGIFILREILSLDAHECFQDRLMVFPGPSYVVTNMAKEHDAEEVEEC